MFPKVIMIYRFIAWGFVFMRCPYCNNKIDKNSVFCPQCGKEILVTCPKCGEKNKCGYLYCCKCGQELSDKETGGSQSKKAISPNQNGQDNLKKQKREKSKKVFSIISMALAITSFLLLFIFAFVPFKTDSFFPNRMFTVIGYASDVLKNNVGELIKDNYYFDIFSAFTSLGLLTALVVVCLVFTITSIPKLIKTIKTGEFFDCSKKVSIAFVIYLSIYVFFSLAIYNDNLIFSAPSGFVVFMVVLMCVFFIFSAFTKEFLQEKHNLFAIITKSIIGVLTLVFLMFIVFSVGGQRFNIFVTHAYKNGIDGSEHDYTQSYSIIAGNYGLMSYLLSHLTRITSAASSQIITIFLLCTICVVQEILVCIFAFVLIKKVFTEEFNKPSKYLFGAISASLMLIGTFVCIILNRFISSTLDTINDLDTYYSAFVSSCVNKLPIICLIFSVLLLVVQIAGIVINTIRKQKEKQSHENQ